MTNHEHPILCKILLILFCVIISWTGSLNAQERTDTLKEVNIKAKRIELLQVDKRKDFNVGQQNLQIDSALQIFYKNQSIARLINEQSTVFVKSYGVNGLATLSFRGASAAQSTVLWNGIPLSNPSLGMADISILNPGLFDKISLQYGSSSALYGSGNVGGALLLENDLPDFKKSKQVQISMGLGSFSQKNLSFQSQYQTQKLRLKANIFYQSAQNDFEYKTEYQELKKMDNSALKGMGGIISLDYNLSKKKSSDHLISFQLWLQEYNREIPPALFENSSVKNQKDQSLRAFVHWQKSQKQSSFYSKLSYSRDFFRYRDGVVLPNNENEALQIYSETGWNWRLGRPEKETIFPFTQHLLLFAPVQFGQAKNINLQKTSEQWRPAIAAAYQLKSLNERFMFNAAWRQEWVINGETASLPGISAFYELWQLESKSANLSLKLRANVQRSYRLPTLNELYFSPGGNPNLKPEKGWNEDMGFVFQWTTKSENVFLFKQETSFFNRNIKDWIYWLGGAIWTPHNLAEVHSRGVETDNGISYIMKKWKFNFSFKTAYTLSTTEQSYLPNDGSIGKQIPYAPRYVFQLNLGIHYKSLFLNYNYHYTGYRFVTVDESQFIQPYQLGNLQFAYRKEIKRFNWGISAQIVNLFNVDYKVVHARPMPGRQYLLSLQLGI